MNSTNEPRLLVNYNGNTCNMILLSFAAWWTSSWRAAVVLARASVAAMPWRWYCLAVVAFFGSTNAGGTSMRHEKRPLCGPCLIGETWITYANASCPRVNQSVRAAP